MTLSREYGCEGYEVATGLVEVTQYNRSERGWSLFTHMNLEEMAGSDDMDTNMVHQGIGKTLVVQRLVRRLSGAEIFTVLSSSRVFEKDEKSYS